MSNAKTTRMQWLDAMRGFTMILVVTYHVAHMSFGMTDKLSSAQPLLVLFRMPLFFFVSGFLAYKANMTWNIPTFLRMSWKKIKIQIIPALFFFLVYMALRKPHFTESIMPALMSETKNGYWFTWVLLQMFLLSYAVQTIFRSQRAGRFAIIATWFVAVGLSALTYIPQYTKMLPAETMKVINAGSLMLTARNLQFFLLGSIVKMYWEKVERMMQKDWFVVMVLATALLSAGDFLVWHNMRLTLANLPRTLACYSLLMTVLLFFHHYADSFTKEHRIGSILQYIGTRTLDIYLLHYFFLPQLRMVGPWMDAHRHNFMLDLTLTLTTALLVIGLCLITSNVLRISPLLSKYLFGRPQERKENSQPQ